MGIEEKVVMPMKTHEDFIAVDKMISAPAVETYRMRRIEGGVEMERIE